MTTSLFSQTYKKQDPSLRKEYQNGTASPVNGHSNGAASSDGVKHRKVRAD